MAPLRAIFRLAVKSAIPLARSPARKRNTPRNAEGVHVHGADPGRVRVQVGQLCQGLLSAAHLGSADRHQRVGLALGRWVERARRQGLPSEPHDVFAVAEQRVRARQPVGYNGHQRLPLPGLPGLLGLLQSLPKAPLRLSELASSKCHRPEHTVTEW